MKTEVSSEIADGGSDRKAALATVNIAIPAELHGRLKAKARSEGRVLRAMVEAKLEELFAPSPITT